MKRTSAACDLVLWIGSLVGRQESGIRKGFTANVQRAISKSMGYSRCAIMAVLGLLMAASSFGQVKGLYSYTAGQAMLPVVATTASSSRSSYIVTMSMAGPGEAMELRAWNDAGSSLVRIGTADWTPGTGPSAFAYAIATLDANRVVAAYVDESSNLYVGVWMVGATNPSPFYLQGMGSTTASGSLGPTYNTGLAITALSATEVVTAAVDPAGNLRVQTWAIDAYGDVTLQNTEVGGGILDVFMVAINSTQVATAVDANSGDNVIRVWQIGSGGAITKQGDYSLTGANNITTGIALAPLGGLLGNYEVMTSYSHNILSKGVPVGTDLQVMSWSISSAGNVTSGQTGTDANGAFQSAIAWTPGVSPVTVSIENTSSGTPESGAEAWKYNETSWSVSSSTNLTEVTNPGSVALVSEGSSGGSIYYVAAFPDSSGNLRVEVLSYTP
jgi:hypothetical protein